MKKFTNKKIREILKNNNIEVYQWQQSLFSFGGIVTEDYIILNGERVILSELSQEYILKLYLLSLLNNSNDGADFYVAMWNKEKTSYSSMFVSIQVMRELLYDNDIVEIKDEHALLSNNAEISFYSFNNNQKFITKNINDFTRVFYGRNNHIELFYKVLEEEKKIIFKLGDKEKTLNIIRDSEFTYKFRRDNLYTSGMKSFLDCFESSLFNHGLIDLIRRKILKVNVL